MESFFREGATKRRWNRNVTSSNKWIAYRGYYRSTGFSVITLALVVGIISLIVIFIKRNKRLEEVEEKLAKLLSEKEK
ncbi:hypothetical protein [Virgibacillus ndiopensis]|uniref:hypothetical protein n=1 Tax=Virgibacillus ndiopensis TaxID=2004408 RepID=UPI0011453757|nr:hypothetical protein [Virgibacillus ndiopensis]